MYKIRTASRKFPCKLLMLKGWLPGMGSNHDTTIRRCLTIMTIIVMKDTWELSSRGQWLRLN